MDPEKEKMGIKGFTVQFSDENKIIGRQGDVVVFDNPLSNVDNCYNTRNGAFTAPKTGIYAFYISGMVASDDQLGFADLAIEKTDNNQLQKVFFRSRGDIFVGGQGSFDVRVKLERGEKVQVRHLGGDLALKGKAMTTFSGVLEHEYTDTVFTSKDLKK